MTIEKSLADRMYNELSNVQGFKDNFPYLMECLKRNHVWTWDCRAITGEVEPKDQEIINRMENEGLHVYAVLEDHFRYNDNNVCLKSFMFLGDEDEQCVSRYDDHGLYCCYAEVHNETWNITEAGSVFVKRGPGGGPRRVA